MVPPKHCSGTYIEEDSVCGIVDGNLFLSERCEAPTLVKYFSLGTVVNTIVEI